MEYYFCKTFILYRESAKDYYQKAGNYEKLIMCYQYLEDFKELEACISFLPEGSRLLERIGEIFFSVGMCSEAVTAYVKVAKSIYVLY